MSTVDTAAGQCCEAVQIVTVHDDEDVQECSRMPRAVLFIQPVIEVSATDRCCLTMQGTKQSYEDQSQTVPLCPRKDA